MNLMALENQERKQLYRLYDIKEFKKLAESSNVKGVFFVRFMNKNLNKITKNDINSFVEKMITGENDGNDKIIYLFYETIIAMFRKKFNKFDELKELLEHESYSSMKEETKKIVESHRKEYDSLNINFEYDALIRFLCELTDEEMENKIIKKELDNAVEENATLKKQNNDLKESLEKYKDLDKEYQTSMMQEICRNELVQEKTSSYISKKSVTTQNSSYTDVRRIPGLVYNVQLIESSNNHATRIHPVEDVVVKLAYKNPKSKTFDIVSIPMHYCSRCEKYFDMKQSFLQTLQKYNLDINYFAASFESETGHPIVFKQMDLREFSKLKLFGYSVGASGLSTGARHELLDFILKNHLMTASEIKSQLQFNIRFIGKKAHMDDAVGDWEKDIDYINNYISSGKIHWRY